MVVQTLTKCIRIGASSFLAAQDDKLPIDRIEISAESSQYGVVIARFRQGREQYGKSLEQFGLTH